MPKLPPISRRKFIQRLLKQAGVSRDEWLQE
jgi:hypothetical protein